MGNDEVIYGDNNGSSYTDDMKRERTHWDPKLQIHSYGGTVSLGIVPPAPDSPDEHPVYDADRAQFITLSRGGCNRAIKALRKYRDQVYGKDE